MAVYCGTCGNRISSAQYNEGSFQTTGEDFGGWDVDDRGRSKISDTCGRCAEKLRAAVTKAAGIIARKCKKRIAAFKAEIVGQRERQKQVNAEKEVFERDWNEHRRKTGM